MASSIAIDQFPQPAIPFLATSTTPGAMSAADKYDVQNATGTGVLVRASAPTFTGGIVLSGAQLATSAIVGTNPGPSDSLFFMGTAITASQVAAMVGASASKVATFTATGGETSYTFSSLNATHTYRIKYKIAAGDSTAVRLQPNGSDSGNTCFFNIDGSSFVKESMGAYSVFCLSAGSTGWVDVRPLLNSDIVAEGNQIITTSSPLPANSVWRTVSKFSVAYTSLKLAMAGANIFTAGDIVELWDLGVRV